MAGHKSSPFLFIFAGATPGVGSLSADQFSLQFGTELQHGFFYLWKCSETAPITWVFFLCPPFFTPCLNFQALLIELYLRVYFFFSLVFEWIIEKCTLRFSKDNRYLREGLLWNIMNPTSHCHYDRGLRGPQIGGWGGTEKALPLFEMGIKLSPYFYSHTSINHPIKGLIFAFGKYLRHFIMYISDLFYSEVSTTAAW